MARRWNAIILATLSLAILSAPAATVAQTPAPGTYRIWLCTEVCTPSDSSRAVGVATVVIVSDDAAAEEPVRSVFAGLRAIRRTSETAATDNVCFSIVAEQRVGKEELYFGIQPRGRTRWHYSANDGFSLRVYLSPDAGYSLRWVEPGPLVRGGGWSFGWAVNTPDHRNAYFAARRIGEPDITQCT